MAPRHVEYHLHPVVVQVQQLGQLHLRVVTRVVDYAVHTHPHELEKDALQDTGCGERTVLGEMAVVLLFDLLESGQRNVAPDEERLAV